MKITSPPEKWKVGDLFIERLMGGYADVCKVLHVGKNETVGYEVISGTKRAFQTSLFDFHSTAFETNMIFRLEDDKKRAFDLIFKNT
jgi:hypothetical protein